MTTRAINHLVLFIKPAINISNIVKLNGNTLQNVIHIEISFNHMKRFFHFHELGYVFYMYYLSNFFVYFIYIILCFINFSDSYAMLQFIYASISVTRGVQSFLWHEITFILKCVFAFLINKFTYYWRGGNQKECIG